MPPSFSFRGWPGQTASGPILGGVLALPAGEQEAGRALPGAAWETGCPAVPHAVLGTLSPDPAPSPCRAPAPSLSSPCRPLTPGCSENQQPLFRQISTPPKKNTQQVSSEPSGWAGGLRTEKPEKAEEGPQGAPQGPGSTWAGRWGLRSLVGIQDQAPCEADPPAQAGGRGGGVPGSLQTRCPLRLRAGGAPRSQTAVSDPLGVRTQATTGACLDGPP